jgi:nicotinamide-nucleotide amidase
VLVTGDEVLRGVIQERNGRFLARSLEARGIAVERILIVGDAAEAIETGLADLLALRVDLVCTSGGLGPTHDDRTMAAVAAVARRPLRVDPAALEMVLQRTAGLAVRARVSEEVRRALAEKQASLPEGARPLPPPGTAAGCALVVDGALVVVLPGPPWELQAMWEAALAAPELAELVRRAGDPDERVLRLYGVPESELVQALDEIGPAESLRIGICAKWAELELTIRASRDAPAAADALEAALAARFGDALYSRDGRGLEAVVAGALTGAGQTLAVAESCTGGLLGARITALAGASEWFLGGVIAYEDAVKRSLLGVRDETLARHGAVSSECAAEMASGARTAIGSDWALSVTGVAGPGGGTPQKPVGLVFVGLAGPEGVEVREHRFRGDREQVRERSVLMALQQLRIAVRATGAPRPVS